MNPDCSNPVLDGGDYCSARCSRRYDAETMSRVTRRREKAGRRMARAIQRRAVKDEKR